MTSFPVPSQPTTSMTRPRLKGMTGDDRNADASRERDA
jgi:hypothetical protein